ncbi:hypothetical protein J2M53_10585 [Arthrobacter sp. zg-ZUI100]|uniref:hypothetical protein n=1 Tax=Arthrobacter jiangjiafuii TaxID=2817475 RepID=UPI001AEE9B91|nr:hypothetical protein [Arthrobacter jiangjiafuii]MBP3036695.1 hypothetical protein [Arthrobacter jiangjiafuii]
MRVDDVADLELDGEFPAEGAEVSFTREDKPIPVDGISVIAYWDETTQEWEPIETEISDDRKTLTATVNHFSIYGVIDWIGDKVEEGMDRVEDWSEGVYSGAGRFLGTHTKPPECKGSPPDWVGPNWPLQDLNNTVLSCWQSHPDDPDILQVLVTNNRQYAGLVFSAAEPFAVENEDFFGLDLVKLSNDLATTPIMQGTWGSDGPSYPITGLTTTTLSYTKEAMLEAYGDMDETGEHLITVETNPAFALIGIVLAMLDEYTTRGTGYEGVAEHSTAVKIVTVIVQANDCARSMQRGKEEGAMTFAGPDILMLANCMSAAGVPGDLIGAHPDWFDLSAGEAKAAAEDMDAFGKTITRVLRVLVAGKVTMLVHHVLMDSFGDANVNTIDFMPSTASFQEFARYAMKEWEEVTTSDRTLVFDIPVDWEVRELPSESNDHDKLTGVSLEVVNADGKVMGRLSSGLIYGQVMVPQLPYHELEFEPLTGLINTDPEYREDPAFVYQALEQPEGFQAMLGLTNFGRTTETEIGALRQGFSFVEGAGGGFFSLFLQPRVVDPESSLSELEWLKGYMQTEEYADIKRMMMSLRFFDPDATAPPAEPPKVERPTDTPGAEDIEWVERDENDESEWEKNRKINWKFWEKSEWE